MSSKVKRYTLKELEDLPTLCQGQTDDLKVDSNGTDIQINYSLN